MTLLGGTAFSAGWCYLPEVLATELRVGAVHEFGNHSARLLGAEEKPLLMLVDKASMLFRGHAGLAFLSDLLLHVRVYLSRRDGDAGNIGLLDGQVGADVIDSGLGRAIGTPTRIGSKGSARRDEDHPSLRLP